MDSKRTTRAAARAVVGDDQCNDDILPDVRLINNLHRLAIGPACRKMIEQVFDPFQAEPVERARNSWAHAFQRFQFRK